MDEEVSRLIVGVSRITEIGEQIYFGKRRDQSGNYPVWSRRIANGFPEEGVRIPYQEYISLGKYVEDIVCRPPNGMSIPFSYVAEHVTDRQAVSAILAILRSIEKAQDDDYANGVWGDAVDWCNGVLDEVWAGRGAFPGIGSVLR